MIILASIGLGFCLCLVLVGTSEQAYKTRITELEEENQRFKTEYLEECWRSRAV